MPKKAGEERAHMEPRLSPRACPCCVSQCVRVGESCPSVSTRQGSQPHGHIAECRPPEPHQQRGPRNMP